MLWARMIAARGEYENMFRDLVIRGRSAPAQAVNICAFPGRSDGLVAGLVKAWRSRFQKERQADYRPVPLQQRYLALRRNYVGSAGLKCLCLLVLRHPSAPLCLRQF